MYCASFDFYGYCVSVKCEKAYVLEDIHRDFSYFSSQLSKTAAVLEVIGGHPPYDRVPQLKATLHTPRNIVYRDGDMSYIDYHGRALTVYNSKERHYKIYCDDRDLAHEIAFLTVLSKVGEHLDTVGLHRVHALGIEAGGRAVLVLLPMAGGKTTLALNLLSSMPDSAGIKLLSEDSPLISANGEVLPFPLRIGVRPGAEPPGIPSKYLRTVKRMEFDPKTLIDIEYFRKKIANPVPAGAILIGERWLAGPSTIRPERRWCAIKPFIKNSVVGLGLYQGVEFMLEKSAWEILGKSGVALARFRNSLKVIRRSRVYRFTIGPDADETAGTLTKFLQDYSACSPHSHVQSKQGGDDGSTS
jgi:hypothetical protein